MLVSILFQIWKKGNIKIRQAKEDSPLILARAGFGCSSFTAGAADVLNGLMRFVALILLITWLSGRTLGRALHSDKRRERIVCTMVREGDEPKPTRKTVTFN